MNDPMKDAICEVLEAHGRLVPPISTLTDDTDLYHAGLTSHASVNVMLALEGRLDIEFPDRMLRRSVFASISSLRAALEELAVRP